MVFCSSSTPLSILSLITLNIINMRQSELLAQTLPSLVSCYIRALASIWLSLNNHIECILSLLSFASQKIDGAVKMTSAGRTDGRTRGRSLEAAEAEPAAGLASLVCSSRAAIPGCSTKERGKGSRLLVILTHFRYFKTSNPPLRSSNLPTLFSNKLSFRAANHHTELNDISVATCGSIDVSRIHRPFLGLEPTKRLHMPRVEFSHKYLHEVAFPCVFVGGS